MAVTARVFAFLILTIGVGFANDLRVTAPERTVQMRVEVLYASGTALFDSDWRGGNIIDLAALPYGSYDLRISSRNLEVKGSIRAGNGFVLADGTRVDANKLRTKADAAGTGTLNKIAKWMETGGAGTLGDSAIAEVSGNVGIGTATPTGRLHVFGAA